MNLWCLILNSYIVRIKSLVFGEDTVSCKSTMMFCSKSSALFRILSIFLVQCYFGTQYCLKIPHSKSKQQIYDRELHIQGRNPTPIHNKEIQLRELQVVSKRSPNNNPTLNKMWKRMKRYQERECQVSWVSFSYGIFGLQVIKSVYEWEGNDLWENTENILA